MKGNLPPEVLNLIPRHPCTYPKHPNRFIQPYAPHCISMPGEMLCSLQVSSAPISDLQPPFAWPWGLAAAPWPPAAI